MNYLVTKQSVVYNVKVEQCLTRDNVPVVVRATVVLRVLGDAERGEDPALVRKFVYEMGVRGLEAQLENSMVSRHATNANREMGASRLLGILLRQ